MTWIGLEKPWIKILHKILGLKICIMYIIRLFGPIWPLFQGFNPSCFNVTVSRSDKHTEFIPHSNKLKWIHTICLTSNEIRYVLRVIKQWISQINYSYNWFLLVQTVSSSRFTSAEKKSSNSQCLFLIFKISSENI